MPSLKRAYPFNRQRRRYSSRVLKSNFQPQFESLEARNLLAIYVVSETSDAGPGSLRQAIIAANNNAGADLIQFNIPGSGVKSISLASPLPALQSGTTIDGSTQPGFQGKPLIELNGSSVTGDGLTIQGANNVIRGLVINRFNGNGIAVLGAGAAHNLISGNYIGTDATGNADLGNQFNGILISGATLTNRIGYPDDPGNTIAESRNVISGNNESGIRIAGSDNAVIVGNYIGTRADGSGDLGNSLAGIALVFPQTVNAVVRDNVVSGNDADGINAAEFGFSNTPTNHFIGRNIVGLEADGVTPAPNTRWGVVLDSSGNRIGINGINVISANGIGGVLVGVNRINNVISGNYVGTDITGTLDRGNALHGVWIDRASQNVIGGSFSSQKNVISGNGQAGIRISGGQQNSILGNYVGTRADGSGALGNTGSGIELIDGSTSNIIGGTGQFDRNIVSGNSVDGIRVFDGNNNSIIGNFVGTDLTGSLSLGNRIGGIRIHNGTQNLIGGLGSGQPNRIANNGGRGVLITSPNAIRNSIRANSIYGNGQLGIDLIGEGVTVNDAMDADSGPNQLMNFPVLHSVITGATTRVKGVMNSVASTQVTVDFFASANADVSGYGEGQRYLGSRTIAIGSSGSGNFEFELSATMNSSEVITATATDSLGNTSEFSRAIAMDTVPPTSSIVPLESPASSRSFLVTVNGSDLGQPGLPASGVESFDIQVSIDGGSFNYWTTVRPQNPSATYIGSSNRTYGFRSVARDFAGNVESKPVQIESSIYVPDVEPPNTEVVAVKTDSSLFVLEIAGNDPGQSGIGSVEIYAQVDGNAVTYVTSVVPILVAGSYRAFANYAALTDGLQHNYRFYSVGIDRRGNVENAAPPPFDRIVAATFSNPTQLAIQRFDVQKGANQRSFIQYLDINFSTSSGVDAILGSLNDANGSNDRIQLRKYNTDGSGSGELLSLSGKLNWSAVDRVMQFDFGSGGIGGDPSSLIGNGYYSVNLDLDGDGSLETSRRFYRLLGDANGDRVTNATDYTIVSRRNGTSGFNLDEDINGDGQVNLTDMVLARRGIGKSILGTLLLDD